MTICHKNSFFLFWHSCGYLYKKNKKNNMSKMNNFFNDFNSFFNEFENLFNHPSRPIRIVGDIKNEEGIDENGKWHKQTITSKDGSFKILSLSRISDNMPKFSQKIDKVSDLKYQLEKCVELQEYEKAAELRDQIKLIELNSETVKKLEQELEDCIKSQNFERAIEIRDELKKLK